MGTWIGVGLSYVFGGSKFLAEVKAYFTRVLTDLGIIEDKSTTNKVYKFLKNEDLINDTRLLWFGDAGIKTRATTVSSTPVTFVSKGYSLDATPNDLTQTTELSQPYLSGNIAPNERYGVKGSTLIGANRKFLSFPTISYNNENAWSASFVVELYTKDLGGGDVLCDNLITPSSTIAIRVWDLFRYRFRSGSGSDYTFGDTSNIIGKKGIVSYVADGLGNLLVYLNGILIHNFPAITNFIFERFLDGRGGPFTGIGNYVRIQDGAMTAQQVADEHTLLRSIYPEIESVQIGTQTWATSNLEMVATPMGNVIPEVQLSDDTSRITNGDFASDTVWVRGAGVTISGGVCTFASVTDGLGISQAITSLPIGRIIRVQFTINSITAGGIRLGTIGTTRTAAGTYTEYISLTAALATVLFRAVGTTSAEIDNVVFQEVGWAGLKLAYDAFIAQGDTVAVATRKCAAWCYYNNDPNIGAVYGKLYNWYAAKLIQNDINAYNAANPTEPWGWRVPTEANFAALEAYLNTDSGNKVKVSGTNYWNAPNDGTNSSGLSVIGSGARIPSGSFVENRTVHIFQSVDNADNKQTGASIRLIKS